MPLIHYVQKGECAESIAARYGMFPGTVWNHGDNADLRAKRDNPNVLAIGDKVVIPDKRKKEEPVDTGKIHRFRRLGVPSVLKLTLKREGRPRAYESYQLIIDGVSHRGTSNALGMLSHRLMPNAISAQLVLGDGEEVYPLVLRNVEPVETEKGQRARLRNLGCGDDLESALKHFQTREKLEATGQPDPKTLDALKRAHGC